MSDNDQQVSENLKELNEIHSQHQKLARALKQLNKVIDKTYGLSVKLVPKKGIYYIEEGWLKPVGKSAASLDQIKSVEFIEEGRKLKIVYKTNDILILD